MLALLRFDPRLACAALALACAPVPVPDAYARPPAPRREPARAAAAPCSRIERIEVHTQPRELRAWCRSGAAVHMRVALGRRRAGPKRRRGDQRTPIGVYRVAGPARASRFHLFIPIDYPSRRDAAVGLAAGTISSQAWGRILAAHQAGALPPQDTALGGHLGLHGEGSRWRGTPAHLDWTLGCIALRDEDIEFLAHRLQPGTPVLLFP